MRPPRRSSTASGRCSRADGRRHAHILPAARRPGSPVPRGPRLNAACLPGGPVPMTGVVFAPVQLIATAGAGLVAEQAGAILLALLVAFAVLAAGRPELERTRAGTMALALIGTPALLGAEIWDSPQI